MPLFVAEIDAIPIIVFAAADHVHALSFSADDFLRSELQELRTPEGKSLITGGDELAVRQATEQESAIWEADLVQGLKDQVCDSREDAIKDNYFAFLVDYREAYE